MLGIVNRLPNGLRNAAAYAAALVAAKVISFLMMPVFTHFLSPADYGRLDVLQTLADLLSVVIGLGLVDTLFRFAGSATSDGDRCYIAGSLYGFALVTGFVFLILVQLAAPIVHSMLPADVGIVETRIILASLSFSAIILVPLGWLRLTDRAGWYFLGTAGRAALQASLAASFLMLGLGIMGVLVAGLIACLSLAGVLSLIHVRETGTPFRTGAWGGYAKYGGPLVLSGIAAFVIGSCDRWILAASFGPENLAPYAVAAKFALMTAMLLQPFEMWWFSKRFSVLAAAEGELRSARYAETGLAIICLAILAVSAAGPLIINFITPADYHGAIAYLPWMCGLVGLRAATNLMNFGLYTGATTLRIFYIEAVSAGLAIVLFLLIIPEHGAWGAIVATGIVLTVRLLVTYHMAQRKRPLPYRINRILSLCAATIGVLVTIALLDSLSIKFAIGIITGMGILVAAFVLDMIPTAWLRNLRDRFGAQVA